MKTTEIYMSKADKMQNFDIQLMTKTDSYYSIT